MNKIMHQCGCSYDIQTGLITICPLHYGRMLEDSTVDYGLLTKGNLLGYSKDLGIRIVDNDLIPEIIPEEKKPLDIPEEPDEDFEDDPGDEPEDEEV